MRDHFFLHYGWFLQNFEKDFIPTLLHTTVDIVASAILFMVAGSDTSANTLAFTCYQLAKNPEIQEKLRNEINSMYKGNPTKESLTYEDLQKMPYLEQVICETLRFHNLTGTVQRVASNDYRLVLLRSTHYFFN